MKCIYVALNQMSAPDVDFLKGTKQEKAEHTPELDFYQKECQVCVHRPAAGYSSSEEQVPFKPAAGQCRTSGIFWHMESKKVPEQLKKGRGSLSFSFCTLHREVIGLSRADSGTSFCEFHTKKQIMDTAQGEDEDWDNGIFS